MVVAIMSDTREQHYAIVGGLIRAADLAKAMEDLFQAAQDAMEIQKDKSAIAEIQAEMALMGMLKNYTEFMTETGQNALAMLAWGQQAATRQIEEGSGKIIDASEALAKRSTKAA